MNKSPFKLFILFCIILATAACRNPYPGMKGVDKKGMGRTPPSMQLKKDYERQIKKANKKIKKQQKINSKLGK